MAVKHPPADRKCRVCGNICPLSKFKSGKFWRKICSDCKQIADLKKIYGLGREDYIELLTKQHGVCAICANPESLTLHGQKKRLSVDHNHTTGKIRGLLCHNCNTALGLVNEDCRVLLSMIRYVEQHLG